MPRLHARTITLAVAGAAAFAFPCSTALAADSQLRLLGLPTVDLGQIVTDLGGTVGGTVDSVLPGTGGIVTETTGSVGGIITGTTDALTQTVDQTVGGILDGTGLGGIIGPDAGGGGSAGGLLPIDALTDLLRTLGIPIAGATSGSITNPDGSITVDSRSPGVKFKVLSTLRGVKSKGKLKLQITTDEAGVVAFTSTVRPGPAVKPTKKTARKKARTSAARHSRKVIHIPSVTLGFRKPGSLKVTVQLSKAAQRSLGNAKSARISVGLVASDASRNQAQARLKHSIKR